MVSDLFESIWHKEKTMERNMNLKAKEELGKSDYIPKLLSRNSISKLEAREIFLPT